jgi:hypothetical protein
MRKALLTSLVIAAATISTKAMADTNWYLYLWGNNTCTNNQFEEPPTPEGFIGFERGEGVATSLQVTRSWTGSIKQVEITYQDGTGQLMKVDYFSSESNCEEFRAALMKNNEAVDPDELK